MERNVSEEMAPQSETEAAQGTPLWVWLSLGMLVALVLAAVTLHITGFAQGHGPTRHGLGMSAWPTGSEVTP
jgi:hypothetical protein